MATRLVSDVTVFKHKSLVASRNFMHASFVINLLALSYRSWYIPFNDHFDFTNMSSLSGSETSTVAGKDLHKYLIVLKNDWSSFLHWVVTHLSGHPTF